MSNTEARGQAARAAPPQAAGGEAAEPTRRMTPDGHAGGTGPRLRGSGVLAAALAGTLLLAAACAGGSGGGSSGPAASQYQQSLAYSECMHSHGAPDFPHPKRGPGGSLIYPVTPPPGMLSSPGYDAAFRACRKLAPGSARTAAQFQAAVNQALRLATCMRAHGITNYPDPTTIGGGIHFPDLTTIGVDPHALQFRAAGKACRAPGMWRLEWWWPAGSS